MPNLFPLAALLLILAAPCIGSFLGVVIERLPAGRYTLSASTLDGMPKQPLIPDDQEIVVEVEVGRATRIDWQGR